MKRFCHTCAEPKEMTSTGLGGLHVFWFLVTCGTLVVLGPLAFLPLFLWIVHTLTTIGSKPTCPDCGTAA